MTKYSEGASRSRVPDSGSAYRRDSRPVLGGGVSPSRPARRDRDRALAVRVLALAETMGRTVQTAAGPQEILYASDVRALSRRIARGAYDKAIGVTE